MTKLINVVVAQSLLGHFRWFLKNGNIPFLIRLGPDFRKRLRRTIVDELWRVFPLVNRLRWKVKRGLWHLGFVSDFIALTIDRIKHGECYVVQSGFCCDTGSFSHEHRYTNPWQAFKDLYESNTTDWSDGPSSACVGDGWMWGNETYNSKAPAGWHALMADYEAEEDERWERRLQEGA